MEIKYQCFISSTFEDLKEERIECMKAILEADHIPAGMEYFKGGRAMKEYIKKWIEESDIVILILGGRYGSVDEIEEIGYTEWEYNYAIQCKKYIIPILLTESYLYEKEKRYREGHQKISAFETKYKKQYKKFKKRIESNENKILCKYANNINDIGRIVISNLADFSREDRYKNHTIGWIKYEPGMLVNSIEEDLNKISYENKKRLLSKLIFDEISFKNGKYNDAIYISNKIVDIIEQYKGTFGKYLRQLARSIDIVLKDQYIEITSSTNMVYVTESVSFPTEFIWNPWLHPGIEVDTYRIFSVQYNNVELIDGYITKKRPTSTRNPFYVNNVIELKIPFDETKTEHQIQYKTNYCVEYDRFFHEYVFAQFCRQFSLVATLEDRRTKKIIGNIA